MEEKQTAPVEQSDSARGTDDQETSNNQQPVASETKEDKVSYDTYRKVLAEKKNTSQKLQEYEQKLKALEEEKLTREGKKDELLETYRQRAEETEKKLKEKEQAWAYSRITSAFKDAAYKKGCRAPEKLWKLLSDEQVNSLEVDDSFNVSDSSLERLLEDSKKENDFLFDRKVSIADGGPSNTPPDSIKPKNLQDALGEYLKGLK